MKTKTHYSIAALDIGSSSISCFVAQMPVIAGHLSDVEKIAHLSVVVATKMPAMGVRHGVITDFVQAEKSIRAVLADAELKLNQPIDAVWVNTAMGSPKVHYVSQKMMFEKMIGTQELEYLHDKVVQEIYKHHQYIVHAVPINYIADNETVLNPLGMRASELEVHMMVMTADLNAIRNLGMCIERCHVDIAGRAFSPYAAAMGCLTPCEMEAGAICIDIGAETMSIAAFQNGRLIFADLLKMGGHYMTRDIAQYFSIPMQAAEILKCEKGTCQLWGIEHETIELPVIGEHMNAPTFETTSRADLVKIIRIRMEEMLELIDDRLQKAGLKDSSFKWIFTGGASQMTGLADLCHGMLGINPRIAYPVRLSGVPQQMNSPAYAVLTGLLCYAITKQPELSPDRLFKRHHSQSNNVFMRLFHWIKYNF